MSTNPNLPPERYIVTFKCKSIIAVDRQGNPKFGEHHQVEIYLHNQYPQRWPGMKWLTPIWHPNINHLNGSVCIDAAWWAASRSLDRLVVMLGEMLQWKNFHDDPTKPPFPWDAEAARWSREYRKKHPNAFPVDQRELLRPERVKLVSSDSEQNKPKPQVKLKPEVPRRLQRRNPGFICDNLCALHAKAECSPCGAASAQCHNPLSERSFKKWQIFPLRLCFPLEVAVMLRYRLRYP